MIIRAQSEALDKQDPLAGLYDEFILPEGVIYLDGNSLGALPRLAPERIQKTVETEWGEQLLRSWGSADWFAMPENLGDRIGGLIGASPGQTVVCDTTSVNIYKALHACMALRPDRKVIVSEASSFPTDLYMVEGAMRSGGNGHSRRLLGVDGDDLEGLLDANVAAVLLSNIDYRTGAVHDMERITRLAHDAGALMIWDLCHSAGVLPMQMDASGTDFAVGCTYKYLNGGPGSPAFIYAARRHHDDARQPLSGWWGHAAPFAFERDYRPTSGIRRFLCGTQPILSMKGVEASLDVLEGVDLQAVRRKSQMLTDHFIAMVEQHRSCGALTLVSPRDADKRGSQVSFKFENGYPVVRAMIERGAIGDFRAPDVMRFGLAPFYLRFADLYDAVEVMAGCMDDQVWNDDRYSTRETVT